MQEIAVIGDVHGEYDKLVKLLSKLPANINICFVGDLIDRGKKSFEVVELVMRNNYDCVKGNHEQMMIGNNSTWKSNGGTKTIKSYHRNGINKMAVHKSYMNKFPYFKYYDIDGYKPLVVSHSYIHHLWRGRKYNYTDEDLNSMLWNRICFNLETFNKKDKEVLTKQEQDNNIFNIFGHTSIESVKITQTYANVDTGSGYKGMRLSAIIYPSMKIFSV